MTGPERTTPEGWEQVADRAAGYYEHVSGEWMIEPCWTGRGVELFKRTTNPSLPWSVVLAFDDAAAAASYVERR